MRVLVLSSVFPNARQPSFGVFIHERMRRVAQCCEVAVVAPFPWFPLNHLFRGRERSDLPAFERQQGVPVHHPRFFSLPGVLKCLDGLFYFLSVLPLVRRIRRHFRFDLIDAHFAYPDGLAAWLLGRLFRCPVTVTLRGTIVPLSRFRLRRRQIQWVLRSVARVFSVSQSLKDVAVSLGAPAEKIRVIPNGVDLAAFRLADREEARRRLGLPLDRTIVLSVGMLSPRKGHQRVIEALPAVVARRPEVLYVVVGGAGVEGDTAPLLRQLIEASELHEHVRLVGVRPHDEIPHWLAAADLFCLATSNEGRANVILEALACGLPVVTTRVGGNPEVIADGTNGLLVTLGDREGLSRALLDALERAWDRGAIAEQAKARSWDHTVEEVLEEFCRLLSDPAQRPGVPAHLGVSPK